MDLQTRSRYMQALGIPVWLPRDMPLPEGETDDDTSPPIPITTTTTTLTPAMPAAPVATPPASATVATTPQPAAMLADLPSCNNFNWETLQQAVKACQLCGLHKTRTQTVFGTGNLQARWMVVGEAPGADEDRLGEPFVGRAGQLLNSMLAAINLPRDAVYIANTLKCRPPNNRDPKPEESAACRGYLERQIALVNPGLVLVVGRIAAHNLLQTTTPIGRLRGKVHTLPGSTIPVVVTYHPAYLLRQPAEKAKAWLDLQMARDLMAQQN